MSETITTETSKDIFYDFYEIKENLRRKDQRRLKRYERMTS